MKNEEAVLKKVTEVGSEGIGFAPLLVWASENKIENADAAATRLATQGSIRIDFVAGKYFSK